MSQINKKILAFPKRKIDHLFEKLVIPNPDLINIPIKCRKDNKNIHK